MSEPFNLDAVVVELDDSEPFPFTWGGQKFELPSFLALPADRQLAIVNAVAGGTVDVVVLADVLQQIVGHDLIAELSSIKGGPSNKPLNTARLMRLVDGWMNQQTGPGKSRASSASSASTGRQSRPTSRSGRGRKTS